MMTKKLDYASLARVVLPVFIYDGSGNGQPIEFCGTGFIIARDVFVTCWHCVNRPLSEDQRYVAVTLDAEENTLPLVLENLERDAGGADLASATIHTEVPLELRLGDSAYILMGHDVWTFGYPYTEKERLGNGDIAFTLNGRLLRGHVTRTFPFDHPEYGEVVSYELDIPAPLGLSGAPLILRGGYDVVGVIYYSHTVRAVAELETPVSFSLAHVTPTLRALRGRATKEVPLEMYLHQGCG